MNLLPWCGPGCATTHFGDLVHPAHPDVHPAAASTIQKTFDMDLGTLLVAAIDCFLRSSPSIPLRAAGVHQPDNSKERNVDGTPQLPLSGELRLSRRAFVVCVERTEGVLTHFKDSVAKAGLRLVEWGQVEDASQLTHALVLELVVDHGCTSLDVLPDAPPPMHRIESNVGLTMQLENLRGSIQ